PELRTPRAGVQGNCSRHVRARPRNGLDRSKSFFTTVLPRSKIPGIARCGAAKLLPFRGKIAPHVNCYCAATARLFVAPEVSAVRLRGPDDCVRAPPQRELPTGSQ